MEFVLMWYCTWCHVWNIEDNHFKASVCPINIKLTLFLSNLTIASEWMCYWSQGIAINMHQFTVTFILWWTFFGYIMSVHTESVFYGSYFELSFSRFFDKVLWFIRAAIWIRHSISHSRSNKAPILFIKHWTVIFFWNGDYFYEVRSIKRFF